MTEPTIDLERSTPTIDDLVDDLIRRADARGWTERRYGKSGALYQRACDECDASAARLRAAIAAATGREE